MVTAEIATYLVGQGLGLTSGTNLFRGKLPDTPDICVVVYEYGGMPNEPEMGGTTVRLEFPSIQIVTRGVKDEYDAPRLLAQQVMAALTKIGGQTLSGVVYGCVMAKQPPFPLGWDDNFRMRFACNYHVQKGYSAT